MLPTLAGCFIALGFISHSTALGGATFRSPSPSSVFPNGVDKFNRFQMETLRRPSRPLAAFCRSLGIQLFEFLVVSDAQSGDALGRLGCGHRTDEPGLKE